MNSTDKKKTIHQLREEFLQKLSEIIVVDEYGDENESDIPWAEPVKILYASLYNQELLGLDDEDYAEFKANIEAGKTAVVGGLDENAPQWLILCFDDGLEVFNIHKLTLELSDVTD